MSRGSFRGKGCSKLQRRLSPTDYSQVGKFPRWEYSRLTDCFSSVVTQPDRLLPSSRIAASSCANSGGTGPLSWFWLRCNCCNGICPNSGGIDPVSWLSSRINPCRLSRFPNSGGIDPVSWFLLRSNISRLGRPPNSGGIDPVSWFLLRYKYSKRESCPSSGGIDPVS